MVKINDKKHITKDGLVKKNPKNVPRYRVYYESPTNFGYEKSDIRFFTRKDEAQKYLDKLRDEMVIDGRETDDTLSVLMEDLVSGDIIGYQSEPDEDEGYQEVIR